MFYGLSIIYNIVGFFFCGFGGYIIIIISSTLHNFLFVMRLALRLHLRPGVTAFSQLPNNQSLCAVWGVIDWWVCVKVANGILWWVLTLRLTCTVPHASFNVWFMVIECSGVRHKCSQFLTTLPLHLPLIFFDLTFSLSPLALPLYFTYFDSNELGGELYQCDCRGWWLIGGRPEKRLNALQMKGQVRIGNDCRTSLTFEIFYVLQNTMIASILLSLICATSERNSIIQYILLTLLWLALYF